MSETGMLTTGSNEFEGGAGDDIFTAGIDTVWDTTSTAFVEVNTITGIDNLVGGDGTDTLDITAAAAVAFGVVSEIETIEIKSTDVLTVDTTAITDLLNLNATGVGAGKTTNIDAATTTDIDVTMKAGNAAIAIDGGNDVNVTLTDVTDANDAVTIGGATPSTGAITVDMTGLKYVAGDTDTLSPVIVTGGTSVSVTQSATSDATAAATDTAAGTITQGAVTVTAGANTTSVTVVQDASQGAVNAVPAIAGTMTTQEVTFAALAIGESAGLDFVVGGAVNTLIFTAKKAMTAQQVAEAFANLQDLDVQADGGNVEYGIWTSAGGNDADAGKWTSGAATVVDATTSKVVFSNAVNTVTAIAETVATAGVVTVGAKVAGINAQTAVTGQMGISNGAVVIEDDGVTDDNITTITVDGYAAASTIGAVANATTALANLTLKNSMFTYTAGVATGTSGAMTVADTAATLALTLENVGIAADDSVLTFTSSPETLNVTSTGNNYVALDADLTKVLNVSGTGVLTDTTDLDILETVTVTGTAGLTLVAAAANTITSVTTTGTTGTVTVSIQGATSTYAGGAGNDIVTITNASTAISKAINLGAGDNTLDLSTTTAINPTVTEDITAGSGIDTLILNAAAALDTARSADTSFAAKFTGFDRLVIADAAGVGGADGTETTRTINLQNLGFSYVTSNGTVADATDATKADILVFDKMANNGTIVLAAAAAGANTEQTVNIIDATTGLTDVLNVITNAATGTNLGALTADQVETINVTVNDTDTTTAVSTNTMVLDADKATSVDLGGAGNLTLTFSTASTEIATINASDMTGALNVTTLAADTGITTVTGGSAADTITLQGANDVAIGGAGNDTLIASGVTATYVTLNGGTGTDTYDVSGFLASSAGAAVRITNLEDNEIIKFDTAATNFISSQVTIDENAGLSDAVDTAISYAYDSGVNTSGIAWFQLGTDTYIVQDATDDGVWVNGNDIIVKITGQVDLSDSSYNETLGTLEYNEIA